MNRSAEQEIGCAVLKLVRSAPSFDRNTCAADEQRESCLTLIGVLLDRLLNPNSAAYTLLNNEGYRIAPPYEPDRQLTLFIDIEMDRDIPF